MEKFDDALFGVSIGIMLIMLLLVVAAVWQWLKFKKTDVDFGDTLPTDFDSLRKQELLDDYMEERHGVRHGCTTSR